MSTKALREVVEEFRSLADKAARTFEAAGEAEALYQRAIAELTAIETAAKGTLDRYPEDIDTPVWETLKSVAENAP